jgi:hypothetical protein
MKFCSASLLQVPAALSQQLQRRSNKAIVAPPRTGSALNPARSGLLLVRRTRKQRANARYPSIAYPLKYYAITEEHTLLLAVEVRAFAQADCHARTRIMESGRRQCLAFPR